MTLKNELWRYVIHFKILRKKKKILLPVISADLNDMLYNCGVCEGENFKI